MTPVRPRPLVGAAPGDLPAVEGDLSSLFAQQPTENPGPKKPLPAWLLNEFQDPEITRSTSELNAASLPAPASLAAQAAPALQAATARYAPQAPANTLLGLQGEALRIGSKGTLADLTANIAEQRALAAAQERADAASANAAVVDEDQAKRFEAMRAEFDESQNKRLADMDELRADIAKTKIDPSQYWSKGSGFGQALSLLSVAIGGFAKGYSGGRLENTGLKMLDQAIDRDIAAQRDNLSTKRGLLAESQSVFSMARQRFGDDQAAAEFTKARQNEMLKNAAARYQGEARTEAMRANAAKLEQHFGLEERRSDNTVQQLYAQAEAARLRAAAGAAAGAASAEEREYDRQLKRKKSEAELDKTKAETEKLQSEARGVGDARKTQGVVSFEGVEYFVPKESAKDLQAAAGAAAATEKQAEQLIELGKGKWHQLVGTSTVAAKGEVVRSALAAGFAKAKSGGFNPSIPMEERTNEQVTAPPRTFGQEPWAATINEIPKLATEAVREHLKAAGAVRVDGKEKKTYSTYESK